MACYHVIVLKLKVICFNDGLCNELIVQGFVMNMQPSEAEAGFDVRLPPTTDPYLLKKRIAEEWAPATRNMTYEVSVCFCLH